jgi:hypothetical protein
MMTLRACPQCRRHFAAEPACPFCGVVAPAPHVRSVIAGHLSRAAVFAGLAGCYTSNRPPQYPPPTPPPTEQPTEFASPPPKDPPPADPPRAAVGSARVSGVITEDRHRSPMGHVPVELHSADQPPAIQPRTAKTDATGRYAFDKLPAGKYILKYGYGEIRRGGIQTPPPQALVQLGNGELKQLDLVVYMPQPDTHLPTPYGAPPMRRRVV